MRHRILWERSSEVLFRVQTDQSFPGQHKRWSHGSEGNRGTAGHSHGKTLWTCIPVVWLLPSLYLGAAVCVAIIQSPTESPETVAASS